MSSIEAACFLLGTAMGLLIGFAMGSDFAVARNWPAASARTIRRKRAAMRADLRRVLPARTRWWS